MFNDVRTVIWKEWKELIGRSTQSRPDAAKTVLVLVVILGIIVWRASFLVNNPAALIVPSFVVIQLLALIMAESFAGERERHTLETLLASRLSDLAILVGKISAGVLLAWGLVLFTLALGMVGSFVSTGTLQFSVGHMGAILLIYLVACLAVSCAAVLVSLRAATVRRAIQTLTWSFMILFFLAIFGIQRLPAEWRISLMRALAGENLFRTELLAILILAGVTLLLFGAARLRFQRARLILD